ncbi:unnamed protein product [Calypogeia fissa]
MHAEKVKTTATGHTNSAGHVYRPLASGERPTGGLKAESRGSRRALENDRVTPSSAGEILAPKRRRGETNRATGRGRLESVQCHRQTGC